MQACQTNEVTVNLLTDCNLHIISGEGELEVLAHACSELTGKPLRLLFPSVSPDYLEQVKHKCLLQPDSSLELNLQVGLNGHARQFHWQVSSRKSDAGIANILVWRGTPLPDTRYWAREQKIQAAILNNMSEAVITLDALFCFTGLNKKAELLFGLTASAVQGLRVHDFVDKGLLTPEVFKALEQVQSTGNWKGSLEFARKGAQVCVAGSMVQVKDDAGHLIGYLTVVNDITTEVRRNAARNRADAQYQVLAEIMNHSGAYAWATDSNGTKKYLNSTLRNFGGIDAEATDVPLAQIFDSQTAAQFHLEDQEVIFSGRQISKVEAVKKSNGETGWYRTLKFPVLTHDGVLAGGFSYDITSEHNQEAELAYLRKRFEVAASITADIISDWDIEHDLLWSSEPRNGMRVHADRSRSMQERFSRLHPEDKSRFIYSLNQALLSSASRWNCEYRYSNGGDDGTYKLLHERGVILRDEAGEAVRMISVVVDVTEKRQLDLDISNKEKQVIAATIEGQDNERNELARELHDNVGQVLAMCKLFVDIASDSVQHEYLDKCREHLNRAIKEIRGLSHRLSPVILDHKGLPGAIADLVNNINQTGKLQFSLNIHEDLNNLTLEKSLKNAAYRIIQEAVSNILKHAEASEATISLQVEQGRLQCCVHDNGKGFNPETVKAGIGLRNIGSRVEFNGGQMQVTSAAGKGCLLEVSFPLVHGVTA